MDNYKFDDTLIAQWCINSETGLYYLIDISGKVLAKRDKDGNILEGIL